MPELPDVEAWIDALRTRILNQTLEGVRVGSPFLVRTFEPPLTAVHGRKVRELRRVGKRIAIGLDQELWLVLHMMVAGRLHWKPPATKISGKYSLAAFDFPNGTLTLTEAGSKRRASLHVVRGEAGLAMLDPGGIDVMAASFGAFCDALREENHTLKRALTDPHFVSGIGNAYSDEILHAAQLSPLLQTQKMSEAEWERLYTATQATLKLWIERFKGEAKQAFPEKVTAFRPEMAVHGQFGKPCPRCGTPVQRIRYADNETNYCPVCQTGGKVLADRGLSRLLGADWPRTLDELEALKTR